MTIPEEDDVRRTLRTLFALTLLLAMVPLAGGQATAESAGPADLAELDGALSAALSTERATYAPGDTVGLSGTIDRLAVDGQEIVRTPIATTFSVEVRTPDGQVRGTYGPFTTAPDGTVDPATVRLPAEATAGLTAPARDQDGRFAIAARPVDLAATDGTTAAQAESAEVTFQAAAANGVEVENSFVSSTGWVKPGDSYPFRVYVRNHSEADASNVQVTIDAPTSVDFTGAVPLDDTDTVTVTADQITWQPGTVAKADEAGSTIETLVVEARAATLTQDPELVWKDLSSVATMTYDGGGPVSSESHGPKVVPPDGTLDTARYGDKPFPMVPVDYTDRMHQEQHTGQELDKVVNDPTFPGSTFNLYQEMSYGQLYPIGAVPSAEIATADWEYEPGFDFSNADYSRGTCRGATYADSPVSPFGTPVYPERIVDGWYQLPGNTEYYGGDYPAFNLGVAGGIDSACGPLGKVTYDAAQIADPEIDYNDFDSDKDGVVDFFMTVFVGCGGNGGSQLAPSQDTPLTNSVCDLDNVPYDNVWPHSSSLEMQFKDEETGLRGYVSDDQLKSLYEIPQCWTNESRTKFADCAAEGGEGQDDLPVYVRVGPYNVNPETSIDSASVISHEYGHHLGLPDFYSSAAYYADLNLMAADYSQHMTIFSKQDMGWVVPRYLQPDDSADVEDWSEIKQDTGEIHWQTADGTPYTLSEANGDQNIHNGLSYGVKLPKRILIDPNKVEEQASFSHIWWSRRGNDFGCSPNAGHNMDVFLPELKDVAEDATVEVTFKSSWDIEWDWDYGFVLTTTDGETYTSHESQNGYSTENTFNPNNQQCFEEHQYGLTGQSGAYEAGEPTVTEARNPAGASYSNGSPFLEDSYDISDLAGGENPVLRFSYFTDAAFDRPGWFIDDIVVTVDGEPIYQSDFEDGTEQGRLFQGGCDPDGVNVAAACTAGWQYVDASQKDASDHAYYLELRDQTGFDFNGHGQSDRGDTSWEPGMFIEYTDENHGYGNNGVPAPPAQHYLDSNPMPGVDCDGSTLSPVDNCVDVSWKGGDDDHFDDIADDDDGPFVNSFEDPDHDSENDDLDGLWVFPYGCLSMDITSMSGQEEGPDPTELAADAQLSDLTADVTLETGAGCITYDFAMESGQTGGQAPVAEAQARPQEATVGQTITFDGSGSTDDETPADDLTYDWDLDGDGTFDAQGQTVSHAYDEAGTYEVTLRVTDGAGMQGTDTVTVTVSQTSGGEEPLPTTGGGAALLGLLALAGAAGLARRMRRTS